MTCEPSLEGLVVQICQKKSISEDPIFASVKNKALKWLAAEPKGAEMDSVYFHPDRFELIVDARGYRPEDLRCTISPTTIDVTAQRQEQSVGAQRTMSTSRNYQLPQMLVPQQAICCLSSDGILLVTVPWQKQ